MGTAKNQILNVWIKVTFYKGRKFSSVGWTCEPGFSNCPVVFLRSSCTKYSPSTYQIKKKEIEDDNKNSFNPMCPSSLKPDIKSFDNI